MKKYISIALILLVFLIIAFFYYALSPLDLRNKIATVNIPRGTNFIRSVDLLEDAGLIKNKYLFYALVIARNAQGKMRGGEYQLSTSMSPVDIINRLVHGDIISFEITIPDDFTVADIAARLSSYNIVDEKAFMSLARDTKFVASLGIEGNSVEGYLYPDTYRIDKSMGENNVIRIMVNQFWKTFTPELKERAKELGMAIPQVVTLASIICKYSGSKEEKDIISAVFHNRLKQGMKLQSDPTAIYGLEREKKLVKKDRKYYRESDTPYNTYRITGLPPGPIANPGIDSLRAALYPAKADYLYIVAMRGGKYKFSTNIDTQNDVSNYR